MLDRVASRLEQYMDLVSARQKLVAANIANAHTPGYKTLDLDFQAELGSFMEGAAPRASEVAGLRVKNDGNNVSLDREARLLAENALRFSVASTLARAEIKAVRMAIKEGRGA